MLDIKILKECGDKLFNHDIGSFLLNNNTEISDHDMLAVYKTVFSTSDSFVANYLLNISQNNLINLPSFSNDCTVTEDLISIDFFTLLQYLISDEEKNAVYLSKIISHLYAVKNNIITDIKDNTVYEFYVNWLKTPGFAHRFWKKYRNIVWMTMSSLPDKNCNWSQDYDDSENHKICKENWHELGYDRYPTVDKKLGYDPLETKRVIQNMFVSIAILSDQPISQEQKEVLNSLKRHEVDFESYIILKKDTWKKFRIHIESLNSLYFLGSGYSLEDSKNKGTYGLQGLKKLLKLGSNAGELQKKLSII